MCLCLIALEKIDKRIVNALKKEVPGWGKVKEWIGRYHYGFTRDSGIGFEPGIVPRFEEVIPLLEEGFKHQGDKISASTLSSTKR